MPNGVAAGGRADFVIQTAKWVIRVKDRHWPAAGAGLGAFPPFIFNPDMPKGDGEADQQSQRNEPDERL